MSDYYTAAAARGAALLDSKAPGWETKVGPDLEMASVKWCVLGHVFGHYDRGRVALGLEAFTSRFGFNIAGGDDREAYDDLRNAWLYEIAQRIKRPVGAPERVADEALVTA